MRQVILLIFMIIISVNMIETKKEENKIIDCTWDKYEKQTTCNKGALK